MERTKRFDGNGSSPRTDQRVLLGAFSDALDLRRPPAAAAAAQADPRHVEGADQPEGNTPVLQFALRKLEALYYLAKLQHGVKGEPRPDRPAGVSDKIEAIPLDEAELGRRLHRIYRELNYAWAIRKPNCARGSEVSRRTIRRRDRFPRIFQQ